MQTIASFLLSRRIDLPAAEERLIEVAPGIQVRCWCYWQEERGQAMTLIIVHGLEGSSESQYMTGLARNGLAAGMKPCAGICPCHIVFLARNVNPRKSNDWFGKSPRRFASLQ